MGWIPHYNAEDAIRLTAKWYADKEKTASEKTIEQINNYLAS
jgi:dTDP-D-glucose 4,6-dehydratase